MVNIREIKVGQNYVFTAKGDEPEALVKVTGIKGRWIKVRPLHGHTESNVAAKDLSQVEAVKTLPSNGLVSAARRAKYVTTRIEKVTYVDCGDDLAAYLRGMELADVYRYTANIIGTTIRTLETQYGHLNPGMQRMSLGNRLRGFSSSLARKQTGGAERAQ